MKITKNRLKRIIEEELASLAEDEEDDDEMEWEPEPPPWAIRGSSEMDFVSDIDRQQTLAGRDAPNEDKYPELLEAIKEVMDLSFGEDNYNMYKELQAIAEFTAKSGPPAGGSKGRLETMWDFDEKSHPNPAGVATPNPFRGPSRSEHDRMRMIARQGKHGIPPRK